MNLNSTVVLIYPFLLLFSCVTFSVKGGGNVVIFGGNIYFLYTPPGVLYLRYCSVKFCQSASSVSVSVYCITVHF